MEKCLDCGGASFLGADVKNKLWHYWAVPECRREKQLRMGEARAV